MANKRKAHGEGLEPTRSEMEIDEGDDSGSDDDIDIVNIDFEWFYFEPSIDFHGLKTLLRQLFDVDNQLFEFSELADTILAQPHLGSTVKCDGKESDPFAFLTVLDLHQHRSKPTIQQLIRYLLSRTADDEKTHRHLSTLLSPDSSAQEEIRSAVAEEDACKFSHYLIISKTYTEVVSKLDAEDDRPQKKKKASSAAAETFYFHAEDEVLRKHAVESCTFDYERQGDEGASDARRAFQEAGIRPQGLLLLIEAEKLDGAVEAVEKYLNADS